MEINQEKIQKNLLPIGIAILSIISLINTIPAGNYFSIIVSIMGLIGAYLHFQNDKPMGYWIELWIIAQVPFIGRTFFATATAPEFYSPIYDATQCLKYEFHLGLGWETFSVTIGFNVVPLILIGLLMWLKIPYQKSNY